MPLKIDYWMGLIFKIDCFNKPGIYTLYMSIVVLYSDFNWFMYACMRSRLQTL